MNAVRHGWMRLPRWFRSAIAGVVARLMDGRRADRNAAFLLIAFATLWALGASVRNSLGTLHGDMLEEYGDSSFVGLGSSKHPPLLSWITYVWFSVLPAHTWAFHLLSHLNAALGMWAVWCATGRFVVGRRRILAVALLGMLPVFTVHAATFNHNTILLSLWPLVALSFLVSIERRSAIWAIAFGVMSGLALLGKYYSVWIILACGMAAILHPNRRAYFLSVRPYLAAAVCCAVVAPHVLWLASIDSAPITRLHQYAGGTVAVLAASVRHSGAYVAYLLPALATFFILERPSLKTLLASWSPMRRVAASIALVPVILPPILLPLASIPVGVPWLYPALFLAPLLIVSAPGLRVRRLTVLGTIAAVSTFVMAGVVLSPALMVGHFLTAKDEHVEPLAALAARATAIWKDRTGEKLRRVGGVPRLAHGLSFYSSDHPLAVLQLRPDGSAIAHIPEERLSEGILGVCSRHQTWCDEALATRLPTAERIEVRLERSFLGWRRSPTDYVIYVQPPIPARR